MEFKQIIEYNKHIWKDSGRESHVQTTKPWLKRSKKICENCNIGWIHYYGIIPDFDTCMIMCGVPLECSKDKNGERFYYTSLTLEQYSQLENQNPKNQNFYCSFEHMPKKLCNCEYCLEYYENIKHLHINCKCNICNFFKNQENIIDLTEE